jgi:uncharacterized protein (TIGR02996 family)
MARARRPRHAAAPPTPALDQLFARLLDHPHDAETRAVYGDALLEHGDPRGELIALQLRRGISGRPNPREGALKRLLWQRELAPLRDLLDSRGSKFEGGFLHRAKLTPFHQPMTAAQLEHAEWRFVRVLDASDLDYSQERAHEPLELVSRIPHLDELVISSRACLEPFVGALRGHRLTTLDVLLEHEDRLVTLERVVRARVFPGVRTLRVVTSDDRSMDRMLAIVRGLPALQHLAWTAGLDHEADGARMAAQLRTLLEAVPSVAAFARWGRATLTRRGTTTHVTFTDLFPDPSLATTLRALGKVTVSHAGKSRALRAKVDELAKVGFPRA